MVWDVPSPPRRDGLVSWESIISLLSSNLWSFVFNVLKNLIEMHFNFSTTTLTLSFTAVAIWESFHIHIVQTIQDQEYSCSYLGRPMQSFCWHHSIEQPFQIMPPIENFIQLSGKLRLETRFNRFNVSSMLFSESRDVLRMDFAFPWTCAFVLFLQLIQSICPFVKAFLFKSTIFLRLSYSCSN